MPSGTGFSEAWNDSVARLPRVAIADVLTKKPPCFSA
jgi:hypothetical protein